MLTGNVGAGVQVRFHWQVMLIDDTWIGGAPFFRVTLNLRAAPQKYLWVFNTNSIYKIKGNKQKLIPVFLLFCSLRISQVHIWNHFIIKKYKNKAKQHPRFSIMAKNGKN